MSKELVTVEISEEVAVEVQPDESHEWLIHSKDVAEGYGLSASGMRMTKSRHKDELEEGKHYLTVTDSDAQSMTGNSKARQVTYWTKKGVVRLGFLIKTPLAKKFRDWAEDFIIEKSEETPKAPMVPMSPAEMMLQQAQLMVDMEKKFSQVDTRIAELEAKQDIQDEMYGVMGYCKLVGLKTKLTNGQASAIGRMASKYSKEEGIAVDEIYSKVWGTVKAYHKDILEKVLKEKGYM